MNVKTLLFVLLIVLLSCEEEESSYINYDKWKLPDAFQNGYLKGRPKEVKEVLYEVMDTTVRSEGKKMVRSCSDLMKKAI